MRKSVYQPALGSKPLDLFLRMKEVAMAKATSHPTRKVHGHFT